MISPINSAASVSARPPAAPVPTAPNAPPTPSDSVAVSGQKAPPARRPIFAEAARLGLMTHGATLGGPLGQALSAAAQDDLGKLLHEMTAAGLSFASHGNPEELFRYGNTTLSEDSVKAAILESNGKFEDQKLTVSDPDKKGMKFAHIKHLSELEGLEALAVKKDASGLDDDGLGATILDLAKNGERFFVNIMEDLSGRRVLDDLNDGTAREVGPYGAWRAMTEPPPPPTPLIGSGPISVPVDRSESRRVYISNVDPEPFSFQMRPVQMPVRLVDAEGVRKAAFFETGAPHAELDADPLAVSLRELARAGMTFHDGHEDKGRLLDRTALGIYLEQPWELTVGVWGEGQEKVTRDQLENPSTLSPKLQELTKFFTDHVAPKMADGKMVDRDVLLWVRAASQPAGTLTTAQKADALEALYADEKAMGTRPEAQAFAAGRAMLWLDKIVKAAEDPAPLLAEMGTLRRRGLSPDTAGEAMEYFRKTLCKISFDEEDFQTQREQLVQVAQLAGSFKQTVEARELIAYTRPFDTGIALLRHTVETDKDLQAPKKPVDINDVSTVLDDGPKPFDQAMADYKLVLAHAAPADETATAAALRALHTVLVPEIGWEGSRQTFVFIQRGAAHHAFGEHSRDEAVSTFLMNYVMGHDLEAACRSVLALGKSTPRVSTDDQTGDVIVGGIRIPKHKG